MNNKITFPRLATMLANRSGRSKRFSEDFLREFFSIISKTLEEQESVKIKGFGTFRLTQVEPRRSVDVTTGEPMEISGHTKVVFTPSKELAEAVNAPFEAFSAIEIREGADIEQLFSTDEIEASNFNNEPITANDNEPDASEFKHSNTVDEEDLEIVLQHEPNEDSYSPEESTETSNDNLGESQAVDGSEETLDNEETPNTKESEKSTNEENIDTQTPEIESYITEDLDEFEEDNARRRNRIRGMMIALGAAVIAVFATLIICYTFGTYDFNRIFNFRTSGTESAPESELAVNNKASDTNQYDGRHAISDSLSDSLQNLETEEEVPTSPSDIVVYDTIGTTRYLTTMARSHYGNYNLWPYIYEENKSFLGHPDRIRPGTPVVIPKLSKYGVDPNSSVDIEKAKKLGVEIYARFGKKI